MKRIDLDDLPPRASALLSGLEEGEELILARDGLVVGRLVARGRDRVEQASGAPDEEGMKEVMEQFNAMIHDEF